MSREVRRVPIDWKHPVEHNPHWEFQQRTWAGRMRPPSRLHGQTERFRPLNDRSMIAYYDDPDEIDWDTMMPDFGVPAEDLGWCLYESVSEGTPTTPVFATAKELIEHLVTVGQDYDQEPMRRESAEQIVGTGFTLGSAVVAGGKFYRSDMDADIIAALPT